MDSNIFTEKKGEFKMEKRNIYGKYIEELIIIKLIINDVDEYLKAERLVKDLKETKHCFQIILGEDVKSSMEVCCDALFDEFPKMDKDELDRIKNFNQGKLFINKDNYFEIIDYADFQNLPAIPQVPIQTFDESCKRTKDLSSEQRYIVQECNSVLEIKKVISNGAFAVIIPAEFLLKEKLDFIMDEIQKVIENSSEETLERLNRIDRESREECENNTWDIDVPADDEILYKD